MILRTDYLKKNTSYDQNNSLDVIHYVNILKFKKAGEKKITKILSDQIREDFLKEFKGSEHLSPEFLKNYHQTTGVRRIRLKESRTVLPIKTRTNKIYKMFQGSSNYAARLFESPKGQWDAEIIDIFTANKKHFPPIPKIARLVKGDVLFFNNKFWRLVKFDINKNFTFLEHFASGNPDVLKNDKDKKAQVIRKIPSSLQRLHPQRVDVSPCGVVKFNTLEFNCK